MIESLIVLTPTRDKFRGCRWSVHAVHAAARLLSLDVEYYELDRRSLIECRNDLLELVKQAHPQEDSLRLFWLDDDVLVPNSEDLANFLYNAENLHYNLVAPYRTIQPTCIVHGVENWSEGKCTCTFSYCHKPDEPSMYTREEVSKLKPFAQIEFAGLGCYFGEMPLNYKFRLTPEGEQTEDLNFFVDHPEIVIRHYPLKLRHLKERPL